MQNTTPQHQFRRTHIIRYIDGIPKAYAVPKHCHDKGCVHKGHEHTCLPSVLPCQTRSWDVLARQIRRYVR